MLRAMHMLRRTVLLFSLVLVLLGGAIAGCATGSNRPLQLVAGAGPEYPAAARQQQVEGYVVLRYDIDIDGRVTGVEVLEASPAGVFDEAAREAVASWRYSPRLVDGEPRAVRGVTSTLRFALNDDGRYDDY